MDRIYTVDLVFKLVIFLIAGTCYILFIHFRHMVHLLYEHLALHAIFGGFLAIEFVLLIGVLTSRPVHREFNTMWSWNAASAYLIAAAACLKEVLNRNSPDSLLTHITFGLSLAQSIVLILESFIIEIFGKWTGEKVETGQV